MTPAVLVTGTGTGIGKTHLAEALLLELRRQHTMVGWKPVESGVSAGSMGDDQARLTAASTPHVRVPGAAHVALPFGDAPSLAAERAKSVLPWDIWMHFARSFVDGDTGLVVELAGGLFSPLTLSEDNADLAGRLLSELPRAKLLLCAPDRLGVLSEVRSALLAATQVDLRVDAIVLIAPSEPDASTGTNRRELERTFPRRVPPPTVFGPMPRMPVSELSEHPLLLELARFSS